MFPKSVFAHDVRPKHPIRKATTWSQEHQEHSDLHAVNRV